MRPLDEHLDDPQQRLACIAKGAPFDDGDNA